jgi:beta-fructofuranosidase
MAWTGQAGPWVGPCPIDIGEARRNITFMAAANIAQTMTPLSLLLGTCSLLAAGAAQPAASPWPLKDKTLVVWVSPADLTQRGGSALTIEKSGGVFDAVVLGEIAPAKWMPGSDFYRRTKQQQKDFPAETADSKTLVQIAIAYKDRQITVYRNGSVYVSYTAEGAERFAVDSKVLMGLRHTDAMTQNRFFTGSIDDARIYDVALEAAQIAALKPNQPSDPKPLAWWDFEDGRAADRMGAFPITTLFGEARLAGGRLCLDKNGAYLMASKAAPETGPGAVLPGDADSSARALREKLLSDPFRACYHFVTPEGSCMPFDPNGAIFWKGRYHLFYIFQDKRGHNWGHVSSTDLFHWRHHPTGLVSGMFSGNCFVNKDGRPTMCYHQVGQGNAMAVALDDDLNEWKKLESNPITPQTKPGDPHHGKYRSWDPYGWLEDDTYYAIFGGERPGLVKAPSLAGEWKYVGDLLANTVPGVSINEDVSCADFFKIGDRRMLLCISHRLGARYYLGDWKNEQFHPTFHEKMSWVDNSFFAPESLLDDKGRRIMWAWIFDGPGFKMRSDYRWSGTMSLPRVLSLGADGMLRMTPPEEIERLRCNGKKKSNLTVSADTEFPLEGIAGNSLELSLEMSAPEARQFGLVVCCSPGGEEQTRVYYDAAEKKLKVDTTKSSLTDGAKTVEAGPFELKAGEPLKLRVFIDKSVVEIFANGRQAVMRRIYPSRPDSLGVKLFSTGGPANIPTLETWELAPSNPY